MNLATLFREFPEILDTTTKEEMNIVGITADPNQCNPGFLYVADESETVDAEHFGERIDGRNFIDKAIKKGAVAILTTPDVAVSKKALAIYHPQPLCLMGILSRTLLQGSYPSKIALITGTDGKTSVVNFCKVLWEQSNKPACSIGNLGAICSDGDLLWERHFTLTVPDTVSLHQILQKLETKGLDHVAAEATSHALFDHRLTGVPATIGAFTNLTEEHLNFHETMEIYFQVKMQLFTKVLAKGSWAILNADSPWFDRAYAVCKACNHRVLSFGHKGETVRLLSAIPNDQGQALKMRVLGRIYQTQLNLHGLFQVYNMLCALAVVIASGIPAEEAVLSIPKLRSIEGRLQKVACTPTGGQILVDFAHTPAGIQSALEACRSFTLGRLFVLFGPESSPNPNKCKALGKIASAFSDGLIVSDAHQRSNNAAKYRGDILSGAPNAIEIVGRPKAIEYACKLLKEGDTLLIAGMGHEKVQWMGDKQIPYSDKDCVEVIINRMHSS